MKTRYLTKNRTAVLFGNRIRQLRNQQGFSQAQFAEKIGFSRTYLGELERGEKNISLDRIDTLASTFGITFSELFENIPSGRSDYTFAMKCYSILLEFNPTYQKSIYQLLLIFQEILYLK